MRVLHVTHQYPPAIGGSEKHMADLSEQLVQRGHQVDVFTSRSLDYHTWQDALPPRDRANGVDIYRFRSVRRGPLAWRLLQWGLSRYWATGSRGYEPLILIGGGPLCPGMWPALLRKLPEYDLVHLNCLVYGPAWYGYQAARRRNVPVVITPHAHIDQVATYGIGYQLDVLRGSDHIVADTESERQFFLDLGFDRQRVTTAGIGLQVDDYPRRDMADCRRKLGLPADAFVVLFLGRQVEYKGLETALDAFAMLRQAYPHLVFLVVGPETAYSRQLFAGHPNWPGVVNLGSVSDDTRLDALSACDCLVLVSAGEAFGMVFLEAWGVEKPVVGPRTAAVSSVIDEGQDGWLVPLEDPLALAGALRRWIRNPGMAAEMGRRGRQKVMQRYTCARVADVVEGVYARTLSARQQALA